MPIVLSFKIKESEIERKIVIIRKEKRTNEKYPRNKNLPKIKPIMWNIVDKFLYYLIKTQKFFIFAFFYVIIVAWEVIYGENNFFC